MPVQTKTATISIATADAVGSTQTVSCGFQPKAIIAFATGNASATDSLATGSVHGSFGAAVSTAERASVAMMSTDNSTTINDGRIARNDAVLCQVLGNGSAGSLLDISAIDTDGFTAIVDDAFTVASRVSFWAIGGADITNASVGWLTAPTSAGDLDITSLAFQPDFIVLFAVAQDANANFTSNARSNLMIGAATAAGQRVIAAAQGPEANADSQSRGYSYDGECIAILANTPTSIGCRALFSQFLSNGFRLNFIEAGTAYMVGFLAIKGGQWRLDDFLSSTTLNDTTAESGFGFQPAGGMVFSHGSGKSTQDTVQTQSRMSIGAFSSTTERVSQAFVVIDAQTTTDNYRSIEHDEVVLRISDTGTLDGLIDISSIDSDGVTFVQDDADPNAAYVWYWAVGNNPSGSNYENSLTLPLSNTTSASGLLSISPSVIMTTQAEAGNAGQFQANSNIDLSTIADLVQAGLLDATGNVSIASSVLLAGGAAISIIGSAGLSTEASVVGAGVVDALNSATVLVSAIIESSSQLDAAGALTLAESNDVGASGLLDAVGSQTFSWTINIVSETVAPISLTINLPATVGFSASGLSQLIASATTAAMAGLSPATTVEFDTSNVLTVGISISGTAGNTQDVTLTLPVVGNIFGVSIFGAVVSSAIANNIAVMATSQMAMQGSVQIASIKSIIESSTLTILQSLAMAIGAGLARNSTVVSFTVTTPDGRTITVRFENRVLAVAAENRTLTVAAENRTFVVPED